MKKEDYLKNKKVQLTIQTSSPIEIPLHKNSDDDSCVGSMSPSKNSIGTQTPVDKLPFEYPPLAVLDDEDDVFAEDSLLKLDEKVSPQLHSSNSLRGIGEKLFSGWFRSREETQEQEHHLGHKQFITRSRSLSCSYEGSKAIGRRLRDIADDLDRQILLRASSSSSSRGRRTVRSHSLREQY